MEKTNWRAKLCGSMMGFGVIAAICLTGTVSVHAAGVEVPLNAANFPDGNFRTCLTEFDLNGDEILQPEEIDLITYLSIEGKNIQNLSGIEHLSKVKSLDCSENLLTTLDLSQNLELVSLYCRKNQLSSLSLRNNGELKEVYAGDNKLATLDVSRNYKLESLACEMNQLTALDVSNNGKLKNLVCHTNQLKVLNLKKNSALESLSCSTNQLKEIDLSGNPALKQIWIEENQLTNIDLSKNPAIASVAAEKNTRSITVKARTRTYDLSGLSPYFDVSKASNWFGGSIKGNVLTVNEDADSVWYYYDLGNGESRYFKLAVEVIPETVTNPFKDVPSSMFYHNAVLWAVEQGITSGTTDTTFSPDQGCTRGQAVTFLWRAAGSPKVGGTHPFTDVKAGAFCEEAVKWAVANGITKGTSDTTFSPDKFCTRGQIVTFLHRYQSSPIVGSIAFDDVTPKIYCFDAVQWAVYRGITNGTSDKTFSPDEICTRAQIVTFLYRLLGMGMG